MILILILFTVNCISYAESQIGKVIISTGSTQKSAIIEILNKPQKYKSEIMSYLSKKRDWNNEKEWPSETILYLVAVIRDNDYFPLLLKYLDHQEYCNDLRMEYGSAFRFAMVLITPKDKIASIDNKPESDAKNYIKQDIE